MFAALSIRNYRLYFTGSVISNIGTWMQRIAQDWLVLELTNSPFAVGITMALQFLPLLLFGLYGGLIADRYDKHRLLLITQTASALLAAAIAILTLGGWIAVWHIYAIAFALGIVTVIDNPARQVFVNDMVPARLVRNAVSLNSGSFQIARLVGPAVAGLLIAAVGSGWAFAINAVSFLATIVALALMHTTEFQRQPHAARSRGQLREGLRYVAARPHILWVVVVAFFIGTFGFNFAILLSAYAKITFNSTSELYGYMNTALAVGSLAGALLAARRATVRLSLLFIVASLFGGSMMVLGATPWLIPFFGVLVVTGMLAISFNTMANASVQLATDAVVRGRVMSLYMLVLAGGTPLGGPLIGAITAEWGAPMATMLSGAICLIAAIVAAIFAARQTRVRLRVNLHRGRERLITIVYRSDEISQP